MIIYYAMTKFHLIFSITHKMDVHKKEAAVLFLAEGMQDIESISKRILESGVFEKVYVVPEQELKKNLEPLREESADTQKEKNVRKFAEAVKNWLPVRITGRDTIYIANDHWGIGTYCIYYHIPYIYYEDGAGMLSKPDYSYELVRRMNVTHAAMAKYLGAFGQNGYVTEKLADLESQTEGFYDTKAKHYSVREKLEIMTEAEMQKILYIFNAPRYEIDGCGTILLTEHFANMKRLSIEGQRELYALLVDLFGTDKRLFIKPHPNDYAVDYGRLFQGAELIARSVPSELLPYCFRGKLDLGLAACSTSVFGLKNILSRTIRFDIDIENYYKQLLKYYVFMQMRKRFAWHNIVAWNVHMDLMEAFGIRDVTVYREDGAYGENSILLIDSCNKQRNTALWRKSMDRFSAVIFLDEEAMFPVDDEVLHSIVPVRIKKESLNGQKTVLSEEEEILWIYSKEKLTIEQSGKIRMRKTMKYSRTILDVQALTNDKDIQIKILEGNLESALVRIEGYLENEKKLNERIRELEKMLDCRDEEMLSRLRRYVLLESEER